MQHPNDMNEVIVRVLSGDATVGEKAALKAWIDLHPENRVHFKNLATIWEQSEQAHDVDKFSPINDWEATRLKIEAVQQTEKLNKTSPFISNLLRIAATLLIFIGVGYAAFKVVSLNSHIEIVATTETQNIVLPDGSQVILNKNSILDYPQQFEEDQRIISLQGEAFFEIKKDPTRPFLIKTGNATTEVLGTSFSINTSSDSVVVTVVTGLVSLYEERNNAVRLAPGERGVARGKALYKKQNEDYNFLSWKSNILEFRNASLPDLAKDISRHFNVPIVLQSEKLRACTVTARFENQNLDQVLDELKLLFPISISTKGDSVLIDGKGCSAF